MKRYISILTIIATLLCSGCINLSEGSASVEDLYVGGISNHRLMLDGTEGCSTTFYINKANYDWEIIDYKGFTCSPNSGSKVESSNPVAITATATMSNHSADTIRLSDLNFKMLSTRFVGISAYQLPQICFPKGNNKVYIDAKENVKEVNVYNMLGVKMSTLNVQNTTANIDMSGYDSGLYILNIETESGIITRQINIIK